MAIYGLGEAQRRLYVSARSAGDLVDQLRRLKQLGLKADPKDVDLVRGLLFGEAGLKERACGDAR